MKKPTIFSRFARAVVHIEGSGLVYVENPKAACTNVKWSLVDAFSDANLANISNIHDRKQTPFLKRFPNIINATHCDDLDFFSVVRHPRARFISAYFDKMYHGRERYVWDLIAPQLGLKVDEVYEPKDILKRMLKKSQYEVDAHIAPQGVNLLFGSLPYTTIFHLESLKQSDELLIGKRRLKLLNNQSHSTVSKVDLTIFDEETYSLIDQYYENDYSFFGYSPNQLKHPSGMIDLPPYRPFVRDFLASRRPVIFLAEFFDGAPKKLNSVEMHAVIDRFTRTQTWKRMPPKIMHYFVTYNVIHDPEMLARFKACFDFEV